MGFYLNKKVQTEISLEEFSYLMVAVGNYVELYEDSADKKVINKMKSLINRLGSQFADNKDNDKPNSH